MLNSYVNTKEGAFSFTCERPSRNNSSVAQVIQIEPGTRVSRIYDRFNIQNTVSRSGSPIVNKVISLNNTTSEGFTHNLRTSATALTRNQNSSLSKSPRRFVIDINSQGNSQIPAQKLSTQRASPVSISPPQKIVRVENSTFQPRTIRQSVGSTSRSVTYANTVTNIAPERRVIGDPATRTVYATGIHRSNLDAKPTTYKLSENILSSNNNHADKFPYPFEPGKGRYEQMLEKMFNNFHHNCYHKITNTKELNIEIEEILQKVVKDAETKLKFKHILR